MYASMSPPEELLSRRAPAFQDGYPFDDAAVVLHAHLGPGRLGVPEPRAGAVRPRHRDVLQPE